MVIMKQMRKKKKERKNKKGCDVNAIQAGVFSES